jgi:ABC-type phosphate transport system substrate-binding protein
MNVYSNQEDVMTENRQRTTRSTVNAASQRPSSPAPKRESRGGIRLGTGLIIFLATLLGSLLGVAADIGDAASTVDQIRSLFDPELCVVGSNTILGDGITMAADWERAFEAENAVRVTIDGIGSVRGVERAASGGCVHVLAMSEPMTDVQYNSLLNAGITIRCSAEIGYDVIAFVTDINNALPAILSRDLANILTGRTRDWSEIGGESRPIRLLARPGSGTTEFVLINVARYRDADITDDQYFPPDTNYQACASNQQCLDLTLATPGSLYWVSSAWMRTQPTEYIRIMPILRGDERPVNPLTQEVDLDLYPNSLIRPLYFYVLNAAGINAETSRNAEEFLTFVRSIRGQQILEQYSFYTFFDRPTDVDVVLPPGFEPDAEGLRPVCRAA